MLEALRAAIAESERLIKRSEQVEVDESWRAELRAEHEKLMFRCERLQQSLGVNNDRWRAARRKAGEAKPHERRWWRGR